MEPSAQPKLRDAAFLTRGTIMLLLANGISAVLKVVEQGNVCEMTASIFAHSVPPKLGSHFTHNFPSLRVGTGNEGETLPDPDKGR